MPRRSCRIGIMLLILASTAPKPCAASTASCLAPVSSVQWGDSCGLRGGFTYHRLALESRSSPPVTSLRLYSSIANSMASPSFTFRALSFSQQVASMSNAMKYLMPATGEAAIAARAAALLAAEAGAGAGAAAAAEAVEALAALKAAAMPAFVVPFGWLLRQVPWSRIAGCRNCYTRRAGHR